MLRLFSALASFLVALWSRLKCLPRTAAEALGAPGSDGPAQHARLWQAYAVVLPIALLAALLLPQVTLVMSPSIDAWAVRKAPGPIARGDLVQFTLVHPIAGPEPVQVTKRALCVPGDRLTRIEIRSATVPNTFDGHYYCNGELLGISLPRDAHGRSLEHMRWGGIVPDGMFYVGSQHPRGFDSRYLGLIPTERLTRMERLL